MHCKDTILRTQNNSHYSKLIPNSRINYTEMIPLLVQSVNELRAQVVSLQGTQTYNVRARNGSETGVGGNVLDVPTLEQNDPNPFTQTTVVRYTLPFRSMACALSSKLSGIPFKASISTMAFLMVMSSRSPPQSLMVSLYTMFSSFPNCNGAFSS